jgi:hypothetical protein
MFNKEHTMQKVLFSTAGDGYWSTVEKTVEITDMRLGYVADDKEFGELRVYFNTATWDVREDGLIYTDRQFKAELREFLTAHGLDGADVDYSEQGMQDIDFVSCDVGESFIASWEAKFGYESFKDVHVVD